MLLNHLYIPIDDGHINTTIQKPSDTQVIVLFSHSPGSGRYCPRNKRFANQLHNAGFATLLCEWNDRKLAETWSEVCDHMRIALCLITIVRWLKNQKNYSKLLPVLYGSSTGAASALIAASEMEDSVRAVVCQNGRLELAEPYLDKVKSPTFIMVGEHDFRMLQLNKKAYTKLECPKRLAILPGITPFFEEPNKVERMEKLVINWLHEYSNREAIS